jgi:hypothetical protein
MGCDIHAYLDVVDWEPNEKTGDPGWTSTFAARLDLGRDYTLFGVLAGVRGGTPVYSPRGLPEFKEMGFATSRDYWLQVTDAPACEFCGECNHVSPQDVAAWRVKTIEVGGITYAQHPDWHHPSWLYHHELEKVVEAYPDDKGYLGRLKGVMSMMKALNGKKRKRSRLIFWFDN